MLVQRGDPLRDRRPRRLDRRLPLQGHPDAVRRGEVEVAGVHPHLQSERQSVRDPWLFQEFPRETRHARLDAFDHPDIPLDLLVRPLRPVRHLGRNPVYRVYFSLHNTPEPVALAPWLALVPLAVDDASARFDLDLNAWETDAGLEATWPTPPTCSRLTVRDLYTHPTPHALAEYLDGTDRAR